MNCPKCGRVVDPSEHGDLTFDLQVWCHPCRPYQEELTRPRDFSELAEWAQKICAAFSHEPVPLQQNPEALTNLWVYWQGTKCTLAEADHEQRCILLFPPGYRLTSLCHELAHIFTSQDHTEEWARTFARLIAWVKTQL